VEGSKSPALHARASAVKVRDQFVMARFGRTSRERYRDAASPALRAALELPGDRWVPFAAFIEATRLACDLFADGDLELATEIGTFAAEANMGPWRALVHRILSPGFVLGLAGQLWSHHYDAGRVSVGELMRADGRGLAGVRLRIDDFPAPSPYHCNAVRGWCLATIRLGRPRDITVEEATCRLRGDPACEFIARWTR
jgi:hypothetical protein